MAGRAGEPGGLSSRPPPHAELAGRARGVTGTDKTAQARRLRRPEGLPPSAPVEPECLTPRSDWHGIRTPRRIRRPHPRVGRDQWPPITGPSVPSSLSRKRARETHPLAVPSPTQPPSVGQGSGGSAALLRAHGGSSGAGSHPSRPPGEAPAGHRRAGEPVLTRSSNRTWWVCSRCYADPGRAFLPHHRRPAPDVEDGVWLGQDRDRGPSRDRVRAAPSCPGAGGAPQGAGDHACRDHAGGRLRRRRPPVPCYAERLTPAQSEIHL